MAFHADGPEPSLYPPAGSHAADAFARGNPFVFGYHGAAGSRQSRRIQPGSWAALPILETVVRFAVLRVRRNRPNPARSHENGRRPRQADRGRSALRVGRPDALLAGLFPVSGFGRTESRSARAD